MGKSKKRKFLSQGEIFRKIYPKVHRPLVCLLCGEQIQQGFLLAHKESQHGEKRIAPSPTVRHKSNSWVSVVQGGLPSLGRGAR